jgi:uncharacterized protein (DUF1330 family)
MTRGRVAVYVPDHPKANNRGYVLRARYVMEQYLGRYLTSDEEVHHINGNKTDDRIENLVVLSKSDHAKLHIEQGDFGTGKRLDITKVMELRQLGFGYKKIAKELGYPVASVKSAVRKIERAA